MFSVVNLDILKDVISNMKKPEISFSLKVYDDHFYKLTYKNCKLTYKDCKLQ